MRSGVTVTRPRPRRRCASVGKRAAPSAWHSPCATSPGAAVWRREEALSGGRLRMTKWIFGLVPMTALIATTAFAAPIWYTKGYETGVRGRVTDVDRSGTQVVIE